MHSLISVCNSQELFRFLGAVKNGSIFDEYNNEWLENIILCNESIFRTFNVIC